MNLTRGVVVGVACRHRLTIEVFTDAEHQARSALVSPTGEVTTDWGIEVPGGGFIAEGAAPPPPPELEDVLQGAVELRFRHGTLPEQVVPIDEAAVLMPLLDRDRTTDGLPGPLLPTSRLGLPEHGPRTVRLDGQTDVRVSSASILPPSVDLVGLA